MKNEIGYIVSLMLCILGIYPLAFIEFQKEEIAKLQQKAVDEQVAVWYVSPEGEKGFKWISDIFEEVAQK